MIAPKLHCLGKLPPRRDDRTLRLASYIRTIQPAAPTVCDWTGKVPTWPMFANDTLGDCTIAAAGHLVDSWTTYAQGKEASITDAAIVAAYSAIGGYVPGNPDTDRGLVELDVLKFWRTTGISGHTIGAFAAVSPGDSRLVKAAIFLFGGIYAGVLLPNSAQSQEVWDVTSGVDAVPASWGGHAISIQGYDAGGLTCVTWGRTQRMTWKWWETYCDECYACLSNDFIRAGHNPLGVDVATLRADLAAVTS